MRIHTWRLVLTGGAIVILGAAGIGLVAAAGTPTSSTANLVSTLATPGPNTTAAPTRPLDRQRLGNRAARAARLLRLGRRIVHVEATVTDRDGNLITIWLDHGTVQSVGGGSLTIAETGGNTTTVKTDADTIVRIARQDGSLDDVKAGVEVFVQSRVTNGVTLAKRILIIPSRPTT